VRKKKVAIKSESGLPRGNGSGLDYPEITAVNTLASPLREMGDKDRVDIIVTNPPFGGEEERGIQSNFPEDKQTAETALLFLQLIMRKLRRPVGGAKGVEEAISKINSSSCGRRMLLPRDGHPAATARIPG
jgi:hypothetical protein